MNKKFICFNNEKTPADGACFFHAMSSALNRINPIPQTKLREIVKTEIMANDKYQKMLYPVDIHQYCDFITRPNSWGGEPEIIILSDYFNLNIIVGVVETNEIIKFREANQNIIFLVYYGGHYDLAGSHFEVEDKQTSKCVQIKLNIIQKYIDYDSPEILINEFQVFISELNKKFDFLDIKNYHIYCVECGCMFMLEEEFVEHKKKYNHSNFQKIENMNCEF